MSSLLLGHIVDALGGSLEGGARETAIARIAPLEVAGPGDLSFLSNPRYQQQLAASRAACVIVAPAMRDAALARGACIVADNPYVYFARATQLWRQCNTPARPSGVHPSAVVDPTAQLHPSATIGPLCVVERGASIGANTVLKSRVTVGEGCHVGARCIVHAGVVIGADGFGFAPENGQWVKIEQLGAVRIGDDVEIGANTCIDRGALQDTVIEDGVKLDNLIQIGHNVRIGKHSAMAGCVGVAGSATIGPLCVVERGAHIGAETVLKSRVTVGEDCRIGARCIVHAGVVIGADGFGFAPENGQWVKIEQLGAVRIGDDVEIGANTCIDRGALQDTVIEDGVKLDNLIQIGHNVRIGKHSAMAGCVGIAGSAIIGAHCTVGGGAIVLGHLELADNVHISAATVVTRSLTRPGQYTGMFPIDDNARWEKNAATLKQLHSLRERIKALELALKAA